MDALRQIAFEQRRRAGGPAADLLFQKAFLDNIRRNGRLRELELVGTFKLRAFLRDRSLRALMKDSFLAPKLLQRGKLHFGGQRVKDRAVVGRIFARCMSNGREVNHGNRLLSRMCPARLVERLRDVGPRLPGQAGRRSAGAGRLDLLRRYGGPFAQSQAGGGPAGAEPGAGQARRHDRAPGPLPHVLDGAAACQSGLGGLPEAAEGNLRDRRTRSGRQHAGLEPHPGRAEDRPGGDLPAGRAAAGRVPSGLLLRLPADASAAGRPVRRLRATQQHGNALGGPGRGAGRLELQDRVLRRGHDAGRRGDRARPFAQDPQRRGGPSGLVHRGRLSDVPRQPRHEASRHRTPVRSPARPGGLLPFGPGRPGAGDRRAGHWGSTGILW